MEKMRRSQDGKRQSHTHNSLQDLHPSWRIIPVSKWLITMVIVSPLNGAVGPLTNGRTLWLINGGDPNYLLTGWRFGR